MVVVVLLMRPNKENNYAGPKCPHGDSACRGRQQTTLKIILTITPMIKYSKFEINIQLRKMQIFNEEIDEISSGKRQISQQLRQVSHLSWGHNKIARVLHVFRSNF